MGRKRKRNLSRQHWHLRRKLSRLESQPFTPDRLIEISELKREIERMKPKLAREFERQGKKQEEDRDKKLEHGGRLSAYQIRDETLRREGFRTYSEYLASDLWRKIREVVISKAKGCAVCGGKRQHVHHRDYSRETLLGMRTDLFAVLCSHCHKVIEYAAGQKRSFEETEAVLAALTKK